MRGAMFGTIPAVAVVAIAAIAGFTFAGEDGTDKAECPFSKTAAREDAGKGQCPFTETMTRAEKPKACGGRRASVVLSAPAGDEGEKSPEAAASASEELLAARRALRAAERAIRHDKPDEALARIAEARKQIARGQKLALHAGGHRAANVTCPIMGTPIDPAKTAEGLTRTFDGKTVAFCCPGCPGKWDELGDEEKQAKLDALHEGAGGGMQHRKRDGDHSMMRDHKGRHAEAVEAGAVNTRCPIMGGKVDPDKVPAKLTRTFEGKTVGFCCAACPAKWDRLTDNERRDKLENVVQ